MNLDSRWTVLGIPIDSVSAPFGGPAFGTELAPTVLRSFSLIDRLAATDAGDLAVRVTSAGQPARDPVSGIVGWPSVGAMTTVVRSQVATMIRSGQRPFLLGGCCALLMGAVAGTRDALGRVALASVDGHLDLYDHRTSPTGEAADLPVAALLGIGWPGLLETLGATPVLQPQDVIVLGARDESERADLGTLPSDLGTAIVPPDTIRENPEKVAQEALELVLGNAFWLHLDLDVLDESVFPATDYLMPNGLDLIELAALLRPLGQSPALVGVSLGCYNPSKDPDGRYGSVLADLLVSAFGPT